MDIKTFFKLLKKFFEQIHPNISFDDDDDNNDSDSDDDSDHIEGGDVESYKSKII